MKKLIPILTLVVILLTACTFPMQQIDEEKLNIVTSFYPMYVMTANIVDGVSDVQLVNLASPDIGCLHDYQLSTQDMIMLETADVLVINGLGMESYLEKVINTYKDLYVIDSSEGIETIEEHDHEEEEEKEKHEHGDNAHVWVSVLNHIKQVQNIRNKLIKIDPKNANKYSQNAEKYINKLNELKLEIQSNLENIQNRDIVTFHEAFEYFAKEFDLNITAVIESEPGIQPSAGELVDTIEKIRSSNTKAIFIEPQYSRTSADVIARELKMKIYTLDPVVTGELNKDEYINKMKNNLENLLEALK